MGVGSAGSYAFQQPSSCYEGGFIGSIGDVEGHEILSKSSLGYIAFKHGV
jgi:hypothetical protein